MAPDLNSVPLSPRPSLSSSNLTSTASSRQPSQLMGPPSVPGPVSPISQLPPASSAPPPPHAMSVSYARGDNTGVGTGPGPLRHPRPLTAAELHLQLEKEQEAVVNRLTRELSQLRAQSASVVSATSSTSTGHPDASDPGGATNILSGTNHAIPPGRRHQRTSSNASARSITGGGAISGHGGPTSSSGWTTGGVPGSSIASGQTPHHSHNPSQALAERASSSLSLSRQNSTASSRRSGASSPSISVAQLAHQQPDHFYTHHHRPSFSSQNSHPPHLQGLVPPSHREVSATSPTTTAVVSARSIEEAAYHRAELEAVKRENDALRRRVRELERAVAARRMSSTSESERSRSGSLVAGVNTAGPRGQAASEAVSREKDGEEDGVRVGESARSVGLGGGH